MADSEILVIQLSDSFGELWAPVAHDLGVGVRVLDAEDAATVPPETAVVVLAAGGAEREALEWLDGHDPSSGMPSGRTPLIAVGADPGRRMAAQLVGHGASDYFALPDDVEILRNALAAAVQRHAEARRRAAGAVDGAKAQAFAGIVGESAALKATLARAARVLAHPDTTALIVGETGTGKELLARAIHEGGPRRGAPFVAVNCSALPDHLVESELFGHERGAFTDAHAAKPGLFEVADGGTLFLDEVGTLPVDVQAKLLRVLEDHQVRRVGGTKSRRVDVRIIAATNENLEENLRSGAFRQDLYFRLSVITLSLPPLRERGDDIRLLAEAFLSRLAAHHGLPAPSLTPPVQRALRGYHWPGNIRELKNAVERALLLSPSGELSLEELIPAALPEPATGSGVLPFPAALDDITTAAARAMVELTDGNRSEAARRLGISRRRLRRLLDGDRRSGGD